MDDKKRVSWAISVIKTENRLIELVDKLNRASVYNYAKLHASVEMQGEKRLYSRIGVSMQDYSNGTGDKNIKVSHNLEPDAVAFLLSRITAGFQEYSFSETKIFGNPDRSGLSTVTKIFVDRKALDAKGQPYKSPWQVKVSNGRGKAGTNANGGKYLISNSYIEEYAVSLRLTDVDFHRLLNRCVQYINAWELAIGPPLIQKAKALIKSEEEEAADLARSQTA